MYNIIVLLLAVLLYGNDKIFIKGGIYNIPSYRSFYIDFKTKKIFLKPFYIDKYEVSNKRFGKEVREYDINLPVVNISYNDALEFCKKNGGDLPTIWQWIVASSFENNHFYLFSTKEYPIKNKNDINVIKDRVVEDDNGNFIEFDGDVVDVYSALIGNNGIVGMLGNVWEITRSDFDYVVVKGGSFINANKSYFFNNLLENRVLKSNLKGYNHIGFRCVYRGK